MSKTEQEARSEGRARLARLRDYLAVQATEGRELNMHRFHNCGSPCCALGYASEILDEVELDIIGVKITLPVETRRGHLSIIPDNIEEAIAGLFDISNRQARWLFGGYTRTWQQQLAVMDEVLHGE